MYVRSATVADKDNNPATHSRQCIQHISKIQGLVLNNKVTCYLNKTEKAFSLNGHEEYDMTYKFFKNDYVL